MPLDQFTDTAVNAFRSQHTDEISIDLLIVRVPGAGTYRFANDGKGVTSNDVFYEPFPFDLPDLNESDTEPESRLTFIAIDQRAAQAVDQTTKDITCDFIQVLASDPDTELKHYRGFVLRDIQVDELLISATMTSQEFAIEQRPPRNVDPTGFPGLWRTQI